MKQAYLLVIVACLSFTCKAQANSWKEFNEFHSLVSKVLHPVMLGNLKPVKDSSYRLLAAAKAWQGSSIPENINAASFKTHITELVAKCNELDEAVTQKKPDRELKALAAKTHETFHALLAACNIKD